MSKETSHFLFLPGMHFIQKSTWPLIHSFTHSMKSTHSLPSISIQMTHYSLHHSWPHSKISTTSLPTHTHDTLALHVSPSLVLITLERETVIRSVVSDSLWLWTVANQAPLSMKFSRQEYWSRLSFPSPENFPNPEIKPRCPALQADSLLSEPSGKLLYSRYILNKIGMIFLLNIS